MVPPVSLVDKSGVHNCQPGREMSYSREKGTAPTPSSNRNAEGC